MDARAGEGRGAPPSGSGPFRLGPYEALECLGSGGFASVYRARDLRSGQFVALKVAPPGTDDDAVRRLMREARAVARLSHPNVVRVYECGVTPEGAYVAMELFEGKTLQDVLDQTGALPVDRALDIALQVLDGLAAAHASRIIHRDVKPGNIFITRGPGNRDIPHLLDFGVSKMGMLTGSTSQHDRTLPGTALGTPGFMAPEQYGSAHAADARADVYGVGATLYAMLTGRLPFDAGTYESWVIKVKGERAPQVTALAPHVSPDLARTVDRALARDPDARWPSAVEFSRALAGYAPQGFDLTGRTRRPDSANGEDRTAPLVERQALLDAARAAGVLGATAAPSTPRTGDEPATEPRPPLDQRVTEPPKHKVSSSARARRRAGHGAWWFMSGVLVGAVLAALGAAIAFWARSRTLPPPAPAPRIESTPTGTAAPPAPSPGPDPAVADPAAGSTNAPAPTLRTSDRPGASPDIPAQRK